jgi:hypothetical protein
MTPFWWPVNAVAPDDRQLQLEQLGDQPPLGPLRIGERRQCLGVGVAWPGAGECTRGAQLPLGALLDQPVAFGQMQIGAQLVLVGVDEARLGALLTGLDDQQRHVLQ